MMQERRRVSRGRDAPGLVAAGRAQAGDDLLGGEGGKRSLAQPSHRHFAKNNKGTFVRTYTYIYSTVYTHCIIFSALGLDFKVF